LLGIAKHWRGKNKTGKQLFRLMCDWLADECWVGGETKVSDEISWSFELRSLLFANTQKRSRSLSLLCDILWRSQFVVAFGSDGMRRPRMTHGEIRRSGFVSK
jgi:hypothetical protein